MGLIGAGIGALIGGAVGEATARKQPLPLPEQPLPWHRGVCTSIILSPIPGGNLVFRHGVIQTAGAVFWMHLDDIPLLVQQGLHAGMEVMFQVVNGAARTHGNST